MVNLNLSRVPQPGSILGDLNIRRTRIQLNLAKYYSLLETIRKGYQQSDGLEGIFLPYRFNENLNTAGAGNNPLYWFVVKDLFAESGFDTSATGMLEVVPPTVNVPLCVLINPGTAITRAVQPEQRSVMINGVSHLRVTTNDLIRITASNSAGISGRNLFVRAIANYGPDHIWLDDQSTGSMAPDVGDGKGMWLVAEKNDRGNYVMVDQLGRKCAFCHWINNDFGAYR